MDIIKQYCSALQRASLSTDSSAHTMDHFQRLFDEARKDFPELRPEQVEVVRYADLKNGTRFGIEFVAKAHDVPDEYTEIDHLSTRQ